MYTRVVAFEWDSNQAAANVRKHGVHFSEAPGVFGDVYCYNGENIRIISARTAGRPEREQYGAQR
jgi:uncharacterized DUF497 family protein